MIALLLEQIRRYIYHSSTQSFSGLHQNAQAASASHRIHTWLRRPCIRSVPPSSNLKLQAGEALGLLQVRARARPGLGRAPLHSSLPGHHQVWRGWQSNHQHTHPFRLSVWHGPFSVLASCIRVSESPGPSLTFRVTTQPCQRGVTASDFPRRFPVLGRPTSQPGWVRPLAAARGASLGYSD